MSFNGDLYPSVASKVMTTKGDMVDYDSERQRLGIGSANQILQVKSSLPSWETVPLADTVLTTAGDVLYENNTPELARLPKGSDADVLTLASGLPSWSAPAGGATVTVGSDIMTSDETTTSGTFSDTALALTCQSSGKFFSTTSLYWAISSDTACFFRFTDGTTNKQRMQGDQSTFGGRLNIAISCTGTSSSQVVNIEFQTAGGTLTLYGQNDQATSRLDMMEVN